MKNKYRHRIPYLILLVIHTALVIRAFYRNKDKKSLVILLCSNIGIAYIFEYVVFNLLRAYKYMPKFLKNKYLDNAIGAVLSQAIYVPFTALFLTANNYGYKAKLIATMYFLVIEKVFISLNIYRTNWWKPIYTFFLLPAYFLISDFLYKHIKNGTPIILKASYFFMVIVTCGNLYYLMAVLRKIRFGLGYFSSWREHFIIIPIYLASISLFTVWSLSKEDRYSTLRIFLFSFIVDMILKKFNIMKTKFTVVSISVMQMGKIIFSVLFKKFFNVYEKSVRHKRNEVKVMTRDTFDEIKRNKARNKEIMEISETGYGYEFHTAADEKNRNKKNIRNKTMY